MSRTLNELLTELEGIYKQIPQFDCPPSGCNSCCGPVQWELIEEINIRRYLNKNRMKYIFKKLSLSDPTCPYSVEKRCIIYPVRPLICRCFGVVTDPLMRCPFKPKNRITITPEKTQKLMKRIRMLSNEVPKSTYERLTKWREKYKPT